MLLEAGLTYWHIICHTACIHIYIMLFQCSEPCAKFCIHSNLICGRKHSAACHSYGDKGGWDPNQSRRCYWGCIEDTLGNFLGVQGGEGKNWEVAEKGWAAVIPAYNITMTTTCPSCISLMSPSLVLSLGHNGGLQVLQSRLINCNTDISHAAGRDVEMWQACRGYALPGIIPPPPPPTRRKISGSSCACSSATITTMLFRELPNKDGQYAVWPYPL
jgi:hypothetical protein